MRPRRLPPRLILPDSATAVDYAGPTLRARTPREMLAIQQMHAAVWQPVIASTPDRRAFLPAGLLVRLFLLSHGYLSPSPNRK